MQRRTRQREAVLACFTEERRPLAPAEAHAILAHEHPSLGIATVYRAVNAFVEAGRLTPTVLDGTTRYELAGREHHYHFLCEECDKTFCIDDCPVQERSLAPKGFVARSHELLVKGTCSTCNRTSSPTRS